MPESTHQSKAFDVNVEITTVGEKATDADLERARRKLISDLESMKIEDLRYNLNEFDSSSSHATGWMVAHQLDMGGVRVLNKNGHLGWSSFESGARWREEHCYDVDPMNPQAPVGRALPDGDFWLSYEEAASETPVFLARAGHDGPMINIGSWLMSAETYEMDEVTSSDPNDLETLSLEISEALIAAGNPSKEALVALEDEAALQFEKADVKEFLERHRPDIAARLRWEEAPQP